MIDNLKTINLIWVIDSCQITQLPELEHGIVTNGFQHIEQVINLTAQTHLISRIVQLRGITKQGGKPPSDQGLLLLRR